jgi:murein DD-endopeptidase MepM/ murein hydrolase activator NlpD
MARMTNRTLLSILSTMAPTCARRAAQCPRVRRDILARFAMVAAVGVATPVMAHAQATSDSARRIDVRVPPTRDSAVVRIGPPRARQGAIIRIVVRPGSPAAGPHDTLAIAAVRGDTVAPPARTDTLAGGAAWTIPRTDTVAIARPATDSIVLRASFFGEPLHFVAADSGTYVAIAAIPVDAPRSTRLAIIAERSGSAFDTITVPIEIARTSYKMEKLTVAPKFGQAPDSALAARIAREQALAAAVSRRSHETPRLWSGSFARPRASRVTSTFGDGRQFNGTVQSRHMGLDLAGAVGAPVIAPGRGVVALVGEFYLAGNAVYVDHGAGLVTAYFHLSAVNVAVGDTITAGDTIGKVGATGRVTGPHLHWVARYGAITVDPASLLDLEPAPATAAPASPALPTPPSPGAEQARSTGIPPASTRPRTQPPPTQPPPTPPPSDR